MTISNPFSVTSYIIAVILLVIGIVMRKSMRPLSYAGFAGFAGFLGLAIYLTMQPDDSNSSGQTPGPAPRGPSPR